MFWKRPKSESQSQAPQKGAWPVWDVPNEQKIVMDMGQIMLAPESQGMSVEMFEAFLQVVGHSELEARRAVLFAPIAFGFDMAHRLGIKFSYPDKYLISKDGSESEGKCSDESVFVAAEACKEEFIATFGSIQFLRIANMSATASAINSALEAGESVEGLKGAVVNPNVIPESRLLRRLGR